MELDSEQQAVVDYNGNTIVIAGPGSGKTRTLVAKAEKLYNDGGDVICLTFTRSAAQEMRDRMPGIEAQTIHAYCRSRVGWRSDYDNLLTDFQRSKVKDRYAWVLVDEVQDLTEEQLDIVMSIAGGNLFAVGDPYQSIYGFNWALGMEAIKAFEERGCKRFYLRNNNRSCPEIVDMLNRIYKRNLVSAGVKTTGTTAILNRTNENVSEVASLLNASGMGFTVRYGASELREKKEVFTGDDKLRVMTCHCSKGLEFDKVIVYKWHPKRYSYGLAEMNLWYTA